MFSRKKFLLTICAFFAVILIANYRVSAAPAIQRTGGDDRYETAIKVSQNNWQNSDYVVLVSGENFPDALSATPLAKKYNAPILLTESNGIRSSLQNELKRLNAKNVIMVGGTGVISQNIETQLKNMGLVSTRIQGTNRYETSVEVAKNIGTNNGVVIASGENFPDAISIASIAAAKQMPIVLTLPTDMPDVTKKFVNSNSSSKYYVAGGVGAISDAAISSISNYKRLSGSDRYETNTAIINEFAGSINFNTVYVANGQGFADALAGSAAAAKTSSPIVLVHNSAGSQQPVIKSNISSVSTVNILGGAGVVSDSVVQRLINGGAMKITIDPGHGGYDSGAVGPSGVKEKDVTLAIGLKVGKILEQNGIDVVYTRTSDKVSWPSDELEDLQARCEISDEAGSNYFVAIHMNSNDASGARGTETYYYDGSDAGRKLAQSIQTELINATGFIDRGIKTANFYVIKNTAAPSVLVEAGFISNPTEEALLASGSFQDKLAKAIANGIMKNIGQ